MAAPLRDRCNSHAPFHVNPVIMRNTLAKLLAVTAVSCSLVTGCVVERHPRRAVVVHPGGPPPPAVIVVGTEVNVPAPPPAVIEEVIIARPGPAHVWVPGAWVWHGRWVWEKGRWLLPPRPGAVWVPHRYVPRGGAHFFVHGGWRF